MDKFVLEKINKYTQSELSEEQLYTFSVILCDNDIDRDFERFSDEALEQLKTLFIGKTGIFDHNPKSSLQNARIFDTEIITDPSRKTSDGRDYIYLKASVYMVRTESNRDLIAEIDGGIKKEVSISCYASKRTCSVCGCDKNTTSCNHTKGKDYNLKMCHVILSDITDAYEWSFVAVPAQVNAGVTKYFSGNNSAVKESFTETFLADAEKELRKDIIRLAYIKGGERCVSAMNLASCDMNVQQLLELKKSLENYGTGKSELSQLSLADNKGYSEYSTK